MHCVFNGIVRLSGLMLMMSCGCSSAVVPPMPETIPFSGKVMLDGKPLDFAIIAFVPEEGVGEQSYAVVGTTNEDGEYELVTRIGKGEQSGAVPGHYKVIMYRLAGATGRDGKPLASIPNRYTDPEQTTLESTIPDDGGTQNFELKRT